jgi:uncharacterized low-complexity protein
MKKTIASTFAAALISAVSFGAVAHAGGDYYEGVQSGSSTGGSAISERAVPGKVGSGQAGHAGPSVGSGDYYEGASRPN